jgi:hypothetical protein
MEAIKIVACCMFVILVMNTDARAKGWRGIVPLHSTHEDVKRLLGTSADSCECLYNLENETIFIEYSASTCEKGVPGGWNVPPGTVISISVTPKVKLPVADLRLDEKRYKKEADRHVIGNVYYRDEEEGITFVTYQGRIQKTIYSPTAKDSYLLCPGAAPITADEAGSATYPLGMLDEYGDLSFDKEKARLDKLATQMKDKPDTRGYIIVYAGRRALVGEAQARAERAKDYLVSEFGIECGRVVAMDGGYREELSIEIWFGSRNAPAPTPYPTVHPSEVQSIKASSAKNKNRRSTRSRCN